MTYGGDAIGRAEGQAIFVRGGIAGELVRARVSEVHSHFGRAQVVEAIEPSPDRVHPPCPHFGLEANSCGGCAWQHIEYTAQLRFKAEIVREQLRRIGKLEAEVAPALPSLAVWAYRNHAQFSVTPDGRPGFQARRSNHVTPIRVCYLIQPPLADWLAANAKTQRGITRVDVRCAGSQLSVVQETGQSPALPIEFQVKGAPLSVSPASFFQVNTSLLETLVNLVVDGLGLRGGETVVDAYSGVGLFTRFIAPRAARVIGIESSASAVADARRNLEPFHHIEVRQGYVEHELASLDERLDAAVLDPPRAGCGPQVIQTVLDKRIPRLVYVSCDPATLARDAHRLSEGGYRLQRVQPVDLFPHTYHVETVTLWEL